MIRTIKIENYKSIEQLELELGRVNVFIGENGGGKSNLLEAIGLAAASAANKLDNEFLLSRGIRLTSPSRMRSGFAEGPNTDPIEVSAKDPVSKFLSFSVLRHDDSPFGKWTDVSAERVWRHLTAKRDTENRERFLQVARAMLSSEGDSEQIADDRLGARGVFEDLRFMAGDLGLRDYLTYSPTEDALRDLSRESKIEPVGIHGEGLFKLLQTLSPEQLAEVKQQLSMIHWFGDLEVLPGQAPSAHSLKIVDQYLSDGLAHFDQRSANEGFLFLLLYACLLVSQYTPRFFAVDNVDAALNPKLAAGAVRMFAELSQKHERQVLLTTHNPGALDGLDLRDDEQRLFIVYRDLEGRTRVRRIEPRADEKDPVRLSEAFLRGYLGGLPNHF